MRINKGLLGAVLLATSVWGSSVAFATVSQPSIYIEQQKDQSIRLTLKNMPSTPIYGIEVEVRLAQPLTGTITFESDNKEAFDVVKVEETSIVLYIADNKNLIDIPSTYIGTIKGLGDVEFATGGRIKTIGENFVATDLKDIEVEYNNLEEDKPEEGKPEEGKPEEGKPEEGKPEEGKPEEGKPEEGKPEEDKPEEDNSDKDNSAGSSTSTKPGSGNTTEDNEEVHVENYFVDTENHWAQNEINIMVNKGILKGYEDGTFKPNEPITRAEIAAVIDRAFQLKESNEQPAFSDVIQNKWYTQSINNLYVSGIVKGRPDGTFGILDNVTNEEVIVMLDRTLSSQNIVLDKQRDYTAFVDQEAISNWAKESVKGLYEALIIQGTPEGSLLPRQGVTRAQVAVMVHRVLDRLE